MTDVNKFLNDPQNQKCRDLLNIDTNDNSRCEAAALSGAGCGALTVVGAAQSCQTTSTGLKGVVKDLMDCQSQLYQNTTQNMIENLQDAQADLFQILKDEGEIFAIEIEIAKETIETEIRILEVISMLNLGLLLLIILFLVIIKSFR